MELIESYTTLGVKTQILMSYTGQWVFYLQNPGDLHGGSAESCTQGSLPKTTCFLLSLFALYLRVLVRLWWSTLFSVNLPCCPHRLQNPTQNAAWESGEKNDLSLCFKFWPPSDRVLSLSYFSFSSDFVPVSHQIFTEGCILISVGSKGKTFAKKFHQKARRFGHISWFLGKCCTHPKQPFLVQCTWLWFPAHQIQTQRELQMSWGGQNSKLKLRLFLASAQESGFGSPGSLQLIRRTIYLRQVLLCFYQRPLRKNYWDPICHWVELSRQSVQWFWFI